MDDKIWIHVSQSFMEELLEMLRIHEFDYFLQGMEAAIAEAEKEDNENSINR